MAKNLLVTYLFIIWLANCAKSQEWHHVYLPTKATTVNAVYESYDHGYVLGGNFQPNSTPTRGLIIKTDINGEMLWHKVISEQNDYTRIMDINQTDDGGMIFTGYTSSQTGYTNPFVMKLTPCGYVDWCKVYNTPNNDPETGQSILQLSDGFIVLVYRYGEDPLNQRIWLYRLDNEGDLLWLQYYAQSDTLIQGEISATLSFCPNNEFLINGFCYYPNPGNPNYLWIRPFLIKVDSLGSPIWELPWTIINSENYYGQGFLSVLDNQGNIYTSGRHIIPDGPLAGDKPSIIITDTFGNELSYNDLLSDTYLGLTHTINWLADSSLVFGSGWTYTLGGDAHVGVIKTNIAGSVIQVKEMFLNDYTFSDGQTTFDNKLLLIGGFHDAIWQSHAYKLNSDLTYDSIYYQPFVYDSLCPYPISSDTIPLDCVLVGIDDPDVQTEMDNLKVYPNPASTTLNIEIPTYMRTNTNTESFSIATILYQWEKSMLDVYDLHGKLRFHQDIPKTQKNITINVADWPEGLYIIRITCGSDFVRNTKMLIQKK